MPPCSSIPAVGQDHVDACDAGARSSRAARSRRCRAMIVSQSGLPAAPSRESPSTSSCVSASTPPCWRQIHERQCPGKAAPFAGHLQENHAGGWGSVTSMLSVRSEQARRARVAGNARSVPFAFARASRGRVACVSCAPRSGAADHAPPLRQRHRRASPAQWPPAANPWLPVLVEVDYWRGDPRRGPCGWPRHDRPLLTERPPASRSRAEHVGPAGQAKQAPGTR